MSKMMDEAVINMPYGLAMGSEISRIQYYQRAQQVLIEREAYKRWLSDSEAKLAKALLLLAERRTVAVYGEAPCSDFVVDAEVDAFLTEVGHE